MPKPVETLIISETYMLELFDQAQASCHIQWENLIASERSITPRKTMDRYYNKFKTNMTFLSIQEPDTARNMLSFMTNENIQYIIEPYNHKLVSFLDRTRSNLGIPKEPS